MTLALAGCGRGHVPVAAQPACPAGVLAQTPEGAYAFTEGWVRLHLTSCPLGSGQAGVVEVVGASAALGFKPGTAKSATLGVLAPASGPAPSVQRFPAVAAAGRDVVLAPMASGPRPTLRRVRLVSAAP